MKTLSIRPLDIVFFRGNKLFGGPGEHAHSLMPPWPSVFSGALRSLIISKNPDLWQQVHGKDKDLLDRLNKMLRVTAIGLQQRDRTFFMPPKDLIFFKDQKGKLSVDILKVSDRPKGTSYDRKLPKVLTLDNKSKPAQGYWLTYKGLKQYLAGILPDTNEVVSVKDLWKTDYRLGIALDADTWSAKEHAIYTSDAVVLAEDTGFLVEVDSRDTPTGTIRLGGDGRAAQVIENPKFKAPWRSDQLFNKLKNTDRFKVILATPGIFSQGWLISGVEADDKGYFLRYKGLHAQLVCAKVQRYTTISGWDLLHRRPKPAQRAVEAGSVYYFEVKRGTPEEFIQDVLDRGLWCLEEPDKQGESRRAEGFNNVWIGVW